VRSSSLLKEADFSAASRHSSADFFGGGGLAALTWFFAVFDGIIREAQIPLREVPRSNSTAV
jgi:hypothetical protein